MKTEHEQQTISVAVLLFSDYVERLFTRALDGETNCQHILKPKENCPL